MPACGRNSDQGPVIAAGARKVRGLLYPSRRSAAVSVADKIVLTGPPLLVIAVAESRTGGPRSAFKLR